MPEIAVQHQRGRRFQVRTGSHELIVDLPVAAGGQDAGPSPVDLFVGGIAACAAEEARAYLQAHHLPSEGMSVACSYRLAPRGSAHLDSIDLTVCVPGALSHDQRVALSEAAASCTAQVALRQPPLVAITVSAGQVAEEARA